MAEKPVGGVEQLESSMGISPGANIQARRFMATHISPRDDKHPQRPIPTAISENDTLEQLNLDIMQFKYPYHRTSTSKILLVTFYRGGSSFLGELFRFNPDFLYWFEPLHGIYFQHLNDPESRLDLHGDADTYVMLDNGTIRCVWCNLDTYLPPVTFESRKIVQCAPCKPVVANYVFANYIFKTLSAMHLFGHIFTKVVKIGYASKPPNSKKLCSDWQSCARTNLSFLLPRFIVGHGIVVAGAMLRSRDIRKVHDIIVMSVHNPCFMCAYIWI